jgi:hypothetical protein
MRSNLAGFMGNFGGNVYVDNEWVKPDTEDLDKVKDTLNNLAPVPIISSSTSALGIEVSGITATSILSPQNESEQSVVKESLAKSLTTKEKTEDLVKELSNPATAEQKAAVEGTVEVFNKTVDAIILEVKANTPELEATLNDLKITIPSGGINNYTKGDVLVMQLMTNLISNTINTLEEVGGGSLAGVESSDISSAANKDKVLSIVNEALFAAKIAEQVSGAATLNLSTQLDLGALIEEMNRSTSSRGEPITLTETGKFIDAINIISKDLISLMNLTQSGDSYTFSDEAYKRFLLGQKTYKAALDHAVGLARLGQIDLKDADTISFDPITVIKYAYATIITEHHLFWKNETTGQTANGLIEAYLTNTASNKKLITGTLTTTDSLTAPTFGDFDYENWPTFLKTRSQAYYETIIDTMIRINRVGGVSQLTGELEKFVDTTSEDDNIQTWYNSL